MPEGKAAAVAPGNDDASTHHVQVSISIKLASKPCDTAAVPAPLARSDSTAAKRASSSGVQKTASIRVGSDSAANPAAASVGADSQHAVQIKLSGLDGLQQEVPAAVGTWTPAGCGQSCELFTVALPDLQLAVTEQRVRSWAAAAAQLQVQVTVSNTAALDATKKPGGPTASAKATTAAGGSVPAVATGTLLVNCAGLLVGDSTASYRWGKPLHAAPAAITPVAEAATSAAEVAVAPAGPASFMPAQAAAAVAAAGPAGQSRFKWSTQDPSGSLQSWLDSAEVEVQLFKVPAALSETLQAEGKAAAGKPQTASTAAAKPTAKHGAGAARLSAADEAAEQAVPPEPCSLLNPELASVLNPVVLFAQKASCLPDLPASRQQLDTLCESIKLRAVWPPLVPPAQQPAASISPWTVLPSSSGHERDALAVRTATFAAPIILLGCDVGQQQLMQLCRSTGLQLQVHDRTALPEPAPFSAARMRRQKELQMQQQQQRQAAAPAKGARSSTLKQGTGARAAQGKASPAAAQQQGLSTPAATAAAAGSDLPGQTATAAGDAAAGLGTGPTVVPDDGEVYGCASVNLSDLVKGRTSCCFKLPLQPVSTSRGGSCLDWKGRPGRYLEANSTVRGWLRCAVPVQAMHASIAEAVAAAMAAVAAVAAAQQASAAVSQPAGVLPEPAASSSTAGAAGSAAAAASTSTAGAKASSKAAKNPSTQSAPGGKATAAAAIRSAAGAASDAVSPVAACSSGTPPDAEAAAQQQSAQPEKLPQPAAHVMLPSKERFPGHMTRAVFRMDYRDSDLLHVLEDSVRQHNAIVLGLAPPPPPTPEELAAAKAAEEAAAAAAAAAAEAAAAAAAGPQRVRSSRPSSAGKAGTRMSSALSSKAAAAAGVKPSATPTASAGTGTAGSGTTAAAASVAGAGGVHDPSALASKAAARRQSAAAAAAQAGTPRSILKQPQLAGAAAAGALAAEPSALTSGMASSRQHQQLRASFAGDLDKVAGRAAASGDDDSGSESDGDEEGELSEADQKLQVALQRYEHVELDQRLLQALSTYQLSPEQVSDTTLDVITGYHLVDDGVLRVFVLEGPAEGRGMHNLVAAIACWALEDQEEEQRETAAGEAAAGDKGQQEQQQRMWLPRHVLYNPAIRYEGRLYGGLGVDLWMLKLHTSLAALGATASSFTGHVRPDCIAGLRCLLGTVQGYTGNSKAGSKDTGGPSPASNIVPAAVPKPSAGVVLLRQMDQYRLWPTAEQLHLVDKKFGGELTKADVLGVEADEDSSDEEDEEAQQAAQHGTAQHGSPGLNKAQGAKVAQPELTGSRAAAAAAKAASAKLQQLLADSVEMGTAPAGAAAAKSLKSRRSSRRSGRGTSTSRRSRSRSRRRGRRCSTTSKNQRAYRPKHALDMDNSVYLHLRMEAHRRRVQRDIQAEHLQALSALSASKEAVREAWATWNPQRAAVRELQQQIEAGTLTLEDTIKAFREASTSSPTLAAGQLDPQQAKSLGQYPHDRPFLWPAPRDPATCNTHPLKPSEHRIEELQDAWPEGGLAGAAAAALASSKDGDASLGCERPSFDAIVRPRPHGLFTQDPGFWQTVHLGGDGYEEYLAQQAAAAKAEWADKVVVKDVHFHGLPGTGDKAAAQADRIVNILKGQPVKKGLKVTHVPPPPVSMFLTETWQPPAAAAAGSSSPASTAADRAKWVSQKDFDAVNNKQRSAVAKPGFSDATTAALHE